MVGITSAVQVGGPGALFWVWIAALAGVMLKYAEVYLGVRYRVSIPGGGYRGGRCIFYGMSYKGGIDSHHRLCVVGNLWVRDLSIPCRD